MPLGLKQRLKDTQLCFSFITHKHPQNEETSHGKNVLGQREESPCKRMKVLEHCDESLQPHVHLCKELVAGPHLL